MINVQNLINRVYNLHEKMKNLDESFACVLLIKTDSTLNTDLKKLFYTISGEA